MMQSSEPVALLPIDPVTFDTSSRFRLIEGRGQGFRSARRQVERPHLYFKYILVLPPGREHLEKVLVRSPRTAAVTAALQRGILRLET
jgi:hypothetical protein